MDEVKTELKKKRHRILNDIRYMWIVYIHLEELF